MLSPFLVFAAVLPVVVLCFFVYIRDPNKEPLSLLLKIFFLGVLIALPVVVVELALDKIFPIDATQTSSFIHLLFNVFMGVALVEEVFKWLVVKVFGYNNKEFDEIYDIIVYSVFSSLGFACIENILYVLSNGLSTAITRAIFSIPGHMCFGVIMGYFFSKAKISSLNDMAMRSRNLAFSLLVPSLMHALYDALLFDGQVWSILVFLLLDLMMVIVCICVVISISKVQNNVRLNIDNGVIIKKDPGNIEVVPQSVEGEKYNYCPVCGRAAGNGNFCGGCGMKLTK